MTDTKLRELYIKSLAKHASNAVREYQTLREKIFCLATEKQYLGRLINDLSLTKEELNSYLDIQILLEDIRTPDNDKLTDLVDRSFEYINAEYQKGKYEGRELRTLFHELFSLIGTEALLKFDQKS